MADSIAILSSGSHPNVAAVKPHPLSADLMLEGYRAGEGVPLGAQMKSNPLDVSAYTAMVVTLALTAVTWRERNSGKAEQVVDDGGRTKLYVTLEGLVPGGGWSTLHVFKPQSHHGKQVASISGFYTSMRASYWFARDVVPQSTITDQVAITWSLSALAMPEAA